MNNVKLGPDNDVNYRTIIDPTLQNPIDVPSSEFDPIYLYFINVIKEAIENSENENAAKKAAMTFTYFLFKTAMVTNKNVGSLFAELQNQKFHVTKSKWKSIKSETKKIESDEPVYFSPVPSGIQLLRISNSNHCFIGINHKTEDDWIYFPKETSHYIIVDEKDVVCATKIGDPSIVSVTYVTKPF